MTDTEPREHPTVPNPERHQSYRAVVVHNWSDMCVRCGAVVGDVSAHDQEHYWQDTAMLRMLQVLDQGTDALAALTRMVTDNAASTDDMIRRIINREAR